MEKQLKSRKEIAKTIKRSEAVAWLYWTSDWIKAFNRIGCALKWGNGTSGHLPS